MDIAKPNPNVKRNEKMLKVRLLAKSYRGDLLEVFNFQQKSVDGNEKK